MKESEKTKFIIKVPKNKPSTVSSVIDRRKVLKSSTKSYRINPKPIYINSSRRTTIFEL